jgi:nucleotide-binding universal stress UspA family protein
MITTLPSRAGRQRIFLDAAGRRSFATFALRVKRLLFLTDLTHQSDVALDYTANLARYFDALVTLLHVCPPPTPTDFFSGIRTHNELFPGILNIGGNNERGSTADLDLLRMQAEMRRSGARCDACLRCGPPAKEAFKVAANRAADLLVISEHHLAWFRSLTAEDPTGTFLVGAPCPVVVVADQPAIAPSSQPSLGRATPTSPESQLATGRSAPGKPG